MQVDPLCYRASFEPFHCYFHDTTRETKSNRSKIRQQYVNN